MRIAASALRPSPQDAAFQRLEFTVRSDRRDLTLHYWVDLPRDLAPAAFPANAQALLLLPLACYLHEDIAIDGSVDPVLLENLKGVQQIWRVWYPDLGTAAIDAASAATDEEARPPQTLASFSGGIDSFFSLLRHQQRITHLLSIAGFNTPIDDLDNMRRDLEPIAAAFGKQHVPVRTNIRYGQNPDTPYSTEEMMSGMAHGCLLAAIAHLMEEQFTCYLIPATHHYGQLEPYGSHPVTDPLFSSAGLRVVHDGAAFNRVERTEVVARSTDALAVLHVCWQDFRAGNCSACQKCLRTMATLDLLGARDRAQSFDWSQYTVDRVAGVWLPTHSERAFFAEIAAAARARGRIDLVRAAECALTASRRRARVLDAADRARRFVVRTIKRYPVSRSVWYRAKRLRDGFRAKHRRG